MKNYKLILVFLLIVLFCAVSVPVYGANYSVNLGGASYITFYANYANGYNISQGFSMPLTCNISKSGVTSYFNYTLPDDGSVWFVVGGYTRYIDLGDGEETSNFTFNETKTTPGTFTGVSVNQATQAANNAANQALAAKNAADIAAAQSTQANTNAQAAKLSAEAAKISADNAVADTNHIINGLLSVDGNLIQDTEGSAIQGIRNLETVVNNINNMVASPPPPTINGIKGLNGATCTTDDDYTVVISATPGSDVTYRVQCGLFDSGWVGTHTITITGLNSSGAHQASIEVKNSAGVVAHKELTFFKI